MPSVSPFYSVNEVKKSKENRVHHNNSACRPGSDIPTYERKSGDGGHRVCQRCKQYNAAGK
jgi:hypothetical protein